MKSCDNPDTSSFIKLTQCSFNNEIKSLKDFANNNDSMRRRDADVESHHNDEDDHMDDEDKNIDEDEEEEEDGLAYPSSFLVSQLFHSYFEVLINEKTFSQKMNLI